MPVWEQQSHSIGKHQVTVHNTHLYMLIVYTTPAVYVHFIQSTACHYTDSNCSRLSSRTVSRTVSRSTVKVMSNDRLASFLCCLYAACYHDTSLTASHQPASRPAGQQHSTTWQSV